MYSIVKKNPIGAAFPEERTYSNDIGSRAKTPASEVAE
jgi:hypothetical protein